MAGAWFATLSKGGTLLVDEFGVSLHTKLSIELVKLFLRKFNYSDQQIVATHDTNILRKDLLRRDQIGFTEKNPMGATDLYSLVEYKINQAQSVRNDASYSKDYLLGKYGAIPYFENTDALIKDFDSVQIPPGQSFEQWQKEGFLAYFLEQMKSICQRTMQKAQENGLITIYKRFPPESDFKCPPHIAQDCLPGQKSLILENRQIDCRSKKRVDVSEKELMPTRDCLYS